jgi:hypothetical protein
MVFRQRRHCRAWALSLAAAASLAPVRDALGLTFNFVPASGMSQQAIDGFAAAGQRWSSLLADPITVNININFTTLGTGILGSTSTSSTAYTYTQTRSALQSDRSTPDDFTSYSNLPAGGSVNMLLNYTSNNPNGSGSATPYLDNDGDANNTTIRTNFANAKALGLLAANNAASDASISFSSSFTWDFDPKNGVTAGAYDFVGVATHEIAHALGFSSGVDILDGNSSTSFFPDDQFTYVKPMDLFRFSTQSVSTGGAGTIDWTADTRDKFFSIDGGATKIASFATGVTHGDGRQASHWKDNLALGIMDPTAAPGEQMQITAFDRQMLDVIGWAPAGTWSWIDPAGGAFDSAVRWSSDVVPQLAQDAVFNLNNTYTISFAAPASTGNAFVRAGNVAMAMGGNPYAVAGGLYVAPVAGDAATLTISGGTVSPSSAAVGGDSSVAGGTGLLAVGAGGALAVTSNLRIWPAGTLQVGGGSVSAGLIVLGGGKIQSTAAGAIASPISSGGGTIQTDAGTLVVSGALTTSPGTTLTKTGPGTLTIAGAQNHGANSVITLSAGVTKFVTSAGGPASAAALTVNANAATNFNASQNLRALSVGAGATAALQSGGAVTVKTSSLAIDPAGRLDLADDHLIVDYSGASVVGLVAGELATGRNGGTWNGPGIASNMVGAGSYHALGYAEASQALGLSAAQTAVWNGQTVDATSVLVKYTYGGDANLDGRINVDDYTRLDFNVALGASGWYNGDFNYDGKINVDDYTVIDFNLPIQGAQFSNVEMPGLSAVPEPTTFAPILLMALAHRRCRSRKPLSG